MEFRKETGIIRSNNLDRISFMLDFIYSMYFNQIQDLSKYKYNKLSNHINTLNNIKEYANILVDKSNPISEIPYLDELIDDNDDYTIDRFKQLPIKHKIKRLFY